MADTLSSRPQIATVRQANDLVRALNDYAPEDRPEWLRFRAIISAGEALPVEPPADVLHLVQDSFEGVLAITDRLREADIPCDGSVIVHCEAGLYRSVKTTAALCLLHAWRCHPRLNISITERRITDYYAQQGKDLHCIRSGLNLAQMLMSGGPRPEPSATYAFFSLDY